MKWAFIFFLGLLFPITESQQPWFLPFDCENRQSMSEIKLSEIGGFGAERVARPNVPAHLHTGVDFLPPKSNIQAQYIHAASFGKVISIRTDGPYAQIIIEHADAKLYTVYEHIADIQVRVGEFVDPFRPIARFFNEEELKKYGWHFHHLHFEVMKVKPVAVSNQNGQAFFHYRSYGLSCYNREILESVYYNPIEFFTSKWK